jgi:hypothetical protein
MRSSRVRPTDGGEKSMLDHYTKVVLTVIAAALVWLALRPAVLPAPAEAEAGVVRVRIEAVSPSVRWSLPVRIEEVSSLTRPLPVKVVDR